MNTPNNIAPTNLSQDNNIGLTTAKANELRKQYGSNQINSQKRRLLLTQLAEQKLRTPINKGFGLFKLIIRVTQIFFFEKVHV